VNFTPEQIEIRDALNLWAKEAARKGFEEKLRPAFNEIESRLSALEAAADAALTRLQALTEVMAGFIERLGRDLADAEDRIARLEQRGGGRCLPWEN
jgi:hypothetical protein